MNFPGTASSVAKKARRKRRQDLRAQTQEWQDQAKIAFVHSCSGIGGPNTALKQGLDLFAAVALGRMHEYEAATSPLLTHLFESRPDTTYAERQLEVSGWIAGFISKTATAQTTVDDLVRGLFDTHKVTAANRTIHQDALRHLVFAAIGWCTMLYTASLQPPDSDFATTTTTRHCQRQGFSKLSEADSSKRPIGTILRNRGLMPLACPTRHDTSTSTPALLPVTHLNYFSLSRLGQVKITWVDDLSQHCEFERYGPTGDIKLFRLPSLCAKICLGENSLIASLSTIHPCTQNCKSKSKDAAKSYMVEVLLSYRLIFGQHSGSRQIFREREKERAMHDNKVDPLLEALCQREYMEGFGDVGCLLRERGVYNASASFPVLGPRLTDLTDYSRSQRPRNLLEVWNDQRDPERVLTFRAVIIFGGMSLILGILQLLVGVMQIVL